VTSKHPHRSHWVKYDPRGAGDDDASVGRTDRPREITRSFLPVLAGPDGTATVTFTPTHVFSQRLTARSVDRAGNRGPQVTYAFRAAAVPPPTGMAATVYRFTVGG
jgi:hypothetical protein